MKFHANLGIPNSIKLPRHTLTLIKSQHAKRAAKNDSGGDFSSFLESLQFFNPKSATVVEVETDDLNQATKIIYRIGNAFAGRDMTFVVVPGQNRYFLKTCWLNKRNDHHSTLDRSQYTDVVNVWRTNSQ